MGDHVTMIKARYKFGQPIVNAFFKLSDIEIKNKLKSIVGDKVSNKYLFDDNSIVSRTIRNEENEKIEVDFYDASYNLVEFNEHFKF